MVEYQFSEHALEMLRERGIQAAWVHLAMEDPQKSERMEDGTIHYVRVIEDYGGRHLRVVVNPDVKPRRIVTAFFDRRVGSMQ